jgi:oligogalacturonide lyase
MTRRTLLGLIPGCLLASGTKRKPKSKPLPANRGEFVRFADPATENPVVRLTAPTHASFLPAEQNRFVSSREAFLVFSSDRGGECAPFRVNLRTGGLTQLAETKGLADRAITLDDKARNVYFLHGGILEQVELSHLRARRLAEGVDDFHMSGPSNEIVVRRQDRLERLNGRLSEPVVDHVRSRGFVRPTGEGCAFCRSDGESQHEFWYAPFGGSKPVLLARGSISCPYWRPDGQTLLFLRQVQHPGYIASELREVALDGSPEVLVSPTSQYAAFAPNTDGSVIVGASRSKAQPDIVLLIRDAQREMVLCEHRARRAETVSPAFSPNSQRVYFQSDHEGRSAIYSVNVELLVERTTDAS